MNVLERQAELGKSLYEINTNTLKEFASLQQENLEKYFAVTRAYGEKLPEVKDVNDFVELQREYGSTLWSNVKDSFEHQNSLFRTALEETRDALKTAFSGDSEEAAVVAKPAAKAKPKAKAKAKAKAKTKAASTDA